MSDPSKSSPADALRVLIEHDLLYLCGTVLGYDKLSAGFHGWMCRWIAETHGRDSLLLVPRGHYKTTIAGIGETIQDILVDPNIRILITSSTPTLPAKTLRAIRAQFERNELLRALYPDVIWGNPKRDAPKWTDDEIVVRRGSEFKEPTILAASAGREITGLHFDKVLCDDIVNREWCNTRDQMDKLEEWFRMLDAILEPGRGWKRILGTRYSDADLYGRLIAELPPQSVVIRQVIEDDRPIFPEEFNEEHIEKMKRDMGPYLFSCQMMNDPVASEDAVFRPEWFNHYKDGDLPEDLDWYVTVDAAFGEQREHDEAAILIHAIDSEGNRYFHRLIHGRFGPERLVSLIIHEIQKTRPRSVGLEQGAAMVLQAFLRREMLGAGIVCHIHPLKSPSHSGPLESGKAKRRIEALAPYYSNGAVWHHESLRNGELEHQLLRYPRAQHDDCADVAAYSLQQASRPARRTPPKKTPWELMSFEEQTKAQLEHLLRQRKRKGWRWMQI